MSNIQTPMTFGQKANAFLKKRPNPILRGAIITMIIGAIIGIVMLIMILNDISKYWLILIGIPISIFIILRYPTVTIKGYGEVNGGGIMDWMFGEPELTESQKLQKSIDANNGKMPHGYHG